MVCLLRPCYCLHGDRVKREGSRAFLSALSLLEGVALVVEISILFYACLLIDPWFQHLCLSRSLCAIQSGAHRPVGNFPSALRATVPKFARCSRRRPVTGETRLLCAFVPPSQERPTAHQNFVFMELLLCLSSVLDCVRVASHCCIPSVWCPCRVLVSLFSGVNGDSSRR